MQVKTNIIKWEGCFLIDLGARASRLLLKYINSVFILHLQL